MYVGLFFAQDQPTLTWRNVSVAMQAVVTLQEMRVPDGMTGGRVGPPRGNQDFYQSVARKLSLS